MLHVYYAITSIIRRLILPTLLIALITDATQRGKEAQRERESREAEARRRERRERGVQACHEVCCYDDDDDDIMPMSDIMFFIVDG